MLQSGGLCGTNLHWVEPNLSFGPIAHRDSRKFPFHCKIKFWHDFYSIQDDVPVLSFLDPRLTDGLGIFGRTFAFSAMYHNIAVGDFAGARLEIVRFHNKYTGKREVEIFTFDERDVVEEAVLNGAIDRTYKIWNEILVERTAAARRQPPIGTDDSGFGF